jgi:hypothetical protein
MHDFKMHLDTGCKASTIDMSSGQFSALLWTHHMQGVWIEIRNPEFEIQKIDSGFQL